MSIIKHEFYKILHKKMLLFIILLLFILNCFLYINEQNKNVISNSKNYYTVEKDYSKLTNGEALTKAAKEEEELNTLFYIKLLRSQNLNEASIKEQITPMLQNLKYPITYDDFIKKYDNSIYMQNPELLGQYLNSVSIIKSQLTYIDSYPDFISSMSKKAENMKSVSIFNKPNTFAFRNVVKTPLDFDHLKDIKLKIGDSTGIVTSTTFNITDLIIMSLIFLLCVYLFLQEIDNGLMGLVKSTANGRLPVILSKLSVLAVFTVFLSLLFNGAVLFLGNYIYGFNDMSRYIQSMIEFRDCTTLLTIKQYLILFLSTKVIVSVITSMIFAMVFTLISNIKSILLTLASFLGVSYLCYIFIYPVSYINIFKYLNIFEFFDVYKLYGEYTNINLLVTL